MSNKVRHLNNDYEKLKMSRHQRILRTRKKRAFILISIFLVVALVLVYQIITTKNESSRVENKTNNTQVVLQNNKDNNKKLKQNVKQLYNNDYLEKLIRQKYYYSKPGETVYGLPGDVSKDVTQN
ncbi:septum formation initiator family protein [Apilactobacillus timberlakei]|uniref:septum formation initiator family protein n=1 Tax=Apilactobacillus timberlakei TaxID=2008380 RepID=UPI001129382B|nr:septum formation initiator family protein [Apilactobacillus timberlakei]TPR17584.1 septum formation initiator family protein [Apilactobacillus timberlakei]TPR19027.1 septum formation initiator family protein [Apilactobacillus timberlakei]TPR20775.1 septum formation initiator family protein [Apilactobacillus timberlakei]TPR22045.1 septum formation initiator family protein [Apilactobacillus timberlakei]